MYTPAQIATIFRQVAAVLEAKDAGFFRVRAYQSAADSLTQTSPDLAQLSALGKLTQIPGIGAAIADKITELIQTGSSPAIDQVLSQVPQGMFSLLELEGVGPKTAYKLATQFHLNSPKTALAKLKKAAESGHIASLEGFGEKSQSDILRAIQASSEKPERRLRLDQADRIVSEILAALRRHPQVKQTLALGSLRRRRDTVGDLDIGVATDSPQEVVEHLTRSGLVEEVIATGDKLFRFIHTSGENIDVKFIAPAAWGSLIQHFTGSKAHNIHLRELAQQQKLSLSEYGIKQNQKLHQFADEADFYQFLGLAWVPPELREDQGEIVAARENKLPRLVETADIRGDFHTHTDYSWASSHDLGASSVAQLLTEASGLGYAYLALGDHNPSQSTYSEAEAVRQIQNRSQKLDNLVKRYEKKHENHQLKVFKSLEVDIKPDGSLALPPAALPYLDFLVISLHSSFSQTQPVLTRRLLTALAHPKVKILGHPTTRILNRRSEVMADWEQVFAFCAKHRIALEVNANPARLDLPPRLVKQALSQGCKLAINTDAHHFRDLRLMPYGIDMARRGWATKADVINTFSLGELNRWLQY